MRRWLMCGLCCRWGIHAIKTTLHGLRHSAASIRLVPDLLTLRLINNGVTKVMGVLMYYCLLRPWRGRASNLSGWKTKC